MNLPATVANALWVGSSLASLSRFERSLRQPARAQQELLRALLSRNADCAYGRAHGFASIRSYEEFARRVPLSNYDDIEPWIERVRGGDARVLTSEPVTHLIPTSGSTGARKLIPFTAALQREFNRAIGPWIADLVWQHPDILLGPAYWSITPAAPQAKMETSVVPIGFSDDASYLGGVKSRLVRAAMVAPDELEGAADAEEFHYQTLLCLLRQRELRLISIWHPSFLGLLLDALPRLWGELLAAIHKTQPRRARELEQADPQQPGFWPHLKLISCWGDAHAELALADLRRRFPRTHIQPKGLLATEAFVTIPFHGGHPVAVCSHFFEFIDEAGVARLTHELREGESYEVVVTTGGGLWRYRLGDQVQATGFVGETPTLRFLGRNGDISDRCGEKLSEQFAAQVIRDAVTSLSSPPRFAMLAPDDFAGGLGYTLYLEGECPPGLATSLEKSLIRNPHYAWCRKLGQLEAARVFQIERDGFETFVARESDRERQLGGIKASALSCDSTWSQRFKGEYRTALPRQARTGRR